MLFLRLQGTLLMKPESIFSALWFHLKKSSTQELKLLLESLRRLVFNAKNLFVCLLFLLLGQFHDSATCLGSAFMNSIQRSTATYP